MISFYSSFREFSNNRGKPSSKSESITETFQNRVGFEHGKFDVIDEKWADWFKGQINDICINNLESERFGGGCSLDVYLVHWPKPQNFDRGAIFVCPPQTAIIGDI